MRYATAVGWQDAVTETPQGVQLLLEASAGAKVAAFPAGYNEWRGRIGVRVQAPARDGLANTEICRLVADFFAVPLAAVALVAGQHDARKALVLRGLTAKTALLRLGVAL